MVCICVVSSKICCTRKYIDAAVPDLLLQKLRTRVDLNKVKSIGGAAQNATVWWAQESSAQLASLSPQQSLHTQLGTAKTFALLHTPSPHDASTATQAQAIEAAIGGPDGMAHRVGTAAHASLAAAQAMKVREGNPEAWARTARGGRLSLASAFVATLFLGRWAALGVAEVSGTGMWNAQLRQWDEPTLEIVAGSSEGGRTLKEMLGAVQLDPGRKLGTIAPYFVERYGFDPGMHSLSLIFPHNSLSIPRDVYYPLHVRPPRDVPIIMSHFFRLYHFVWLNGRSPHRRIALSSNEALQSFPPSRTRSL